MTTHAGFGCVWNAYRNKSMALTDVDTIEKGAEVEDGDKRNQVPVNLSSQFADGDGVQLSGSNV